MSAATVGRGSSISQNLRTTKEILHDVVFGAKMMIVLGKAEFDALEQDAFEVLHLIRCWRNAVAPINRIPPEILAHIPDFWSTGDRDQNVIALTHVCQAWREIVISRSSLWTDIGQDPDKAEAYLKRSNSFPISLSLCRKSSDKSFPADSLLRIIPQAIGRLRSLTTSGTPGYIQGVIDHLSHPAPLLEHLSIATRHERLPRRDPLLTSAHFDGDLSSLRTLRLESIHTELPWRNMVNLTSFRLVRVSGVSVGQILDFFESAPHLCKVKLDSITPVPGAEKGRLVPLACLKRMDITGGESSSPLLDHILVPVGAHLTIWVNLPAPPIEHHPPRFFQNLRNLHGFTAIELHGDDGYPHMEFSGPSGEVTLVLITPHDNEACLVLESLAHFDTSKTEQLRIDLNDATPPDLLHQALLPMKDLHSLTLTYSQNPLVLIHLLDPIMSPPIVVCPKLEELVINHWKKPDVMDVIGMAAARESRGARLKLVRTISRLKSIDVLELKKHVLHVECGHDIEVDDYSDSGGGD